MPSVGIIGTRGYPSYYGGFETAVRKLAPYLADSGWDVTVYGRRGASKRADPSADNRIEVRVTAGVESKSLSTLSHGATAAFDASRRKLDAVLVMNVANGYWLPLLKWRGIPTVVNVDGIEWEREKWSALGRAAFFGGAKATARHARELVVDADAIGDRWKQRFGRGGTFIPYGGEDSPEYPIEPGLRHRQYVLAVARFVPENSVPEFLEAAKELAQDVDVVLVGSSGYGGELDEAARELDAALDRFHWLGHVSDDRRLHSLWQHTGAYFHGHSVGGTNPALVQAMMCGAPTVARDTVYSREVLAEGGIYVEAKPQSIARELKSLLSDPARQEKLSKMNRERAMESYTWESVCERYDLLLRSVLTPEQLLSLRRSDGGDGHASASDQ